MALPNNNISFTTVKNALGETKNTLSGLCTSDKINPWSKWRPISGTSPITQTSANNRVVDVPTVNPSSLAGNLDTWGTNPIGHPSNNYRLGDFRFYEHNATVPFQYTYSSGGNDSLIFNAGQYINQTSNNNSYTVKDILSNKGLPIGATLGVAIYYSGPAANDIFLKYVSNINGGGGNTMINISDEHLTGINLDWYTGTIYYLPMFDPGSTGNNLIPALKKSGDRYVLDYVSQDKVFGDPFKVVVVNLVKAPSNVVTQNFYYEIDIRVPEGYIGGEYSKVEMELYDSNATEYRKTITLYNGNPITLTVGEVRTYSGNDTYTNLDGLPMQNVYKIYIDDELMLQGELPLPYEHMRLEHSSSITNIFLFKNTVNNINSLDPDPNKYKPVTTGGSDYKDVAMPMKVNDINPTTYYIALQGDIVNVYTHSQGNWRFLDTVRLTANSVYQLPPI